MPQSYKAMIRYQKLYIFIMPDKLLAKILFPVNLCLLLYLEN